jgi:HD superfamily phosphohydrolase
MLKLSHEFRDPVHVFVRVTSQEREVIDSRPFQRLRHIHQLAMTYLLYPGATHKRFEHSLGVMDLADRVYSVVTAPENLRGSVREYCPEIRDPFERDYWRRVLRVAALCHDIGHLPFSHAAEKDLLPPDWDHEHLTVEFIRCPEMLALWEKMTPPLRPDDIAKTAVGPKHGKALKFDYTDWETLLAEIIVGEAFGVDRMDYLLRDSLHTGVAYGRFDHHRLIDSLRILPRYEDEDGPGPPVLGVDGGGLLSAEALMLARYFMFSQVYLHHVRRAYDIHLKDFLKCWLPGGFFPIETTALVNLTDNEVLAGLYAAAQDRSASGHEHALRIVRHKHFKALPCESDRMGEALGIETLKRVYQAIAQEFGEDRVRLDEVGAKRPSPDFPVLGRDDKIISSLVRSEVLQHLPIVTQDHVLIDRDLFDKASDWLRKHLDEITLPATEEDEP